MTSFVVHFTNLSCDGCGKVIRTMGDTAASARKRAAASGWKSGRKAAGRGKRLYDACQDCELPEGYT